MQRFGVQTFFQILGAQAAKKWQPAEGSGYETKGDGDLLSALGIQAYSIYGIN